MTTKEKNELIKKGTWRFTTQQEGYGRQGLYVEGHKLMSVYPNVEEGFNIAHESEAFGAFYDKKTGEKFLTDNNGDAYVMKVHAWWEEDGTFHNEKILTDVAEDDIYDWIKADRPERYEGDDIYYPPCQKVLIESTMVDVEFGYFDANGNLLDDIYTDLDEWLSNRLNTDVWELLGNLDEDDEKWEFEEISRIMGLKDLTFD